MLFPKNRMRFMTSFQGKSEAEGWLVLDLAGFDLEGVTKLTLSLADIQKIREAGDVATDRLKAARALLGGDSDNDADEE